MTKEQALKEYVGVFRRDLRAKGHASFLEGEVAQLRQQCIAFGIDEKEIGEAEDIIISRYYEAQKKKELVPSGIGIELFWNTGW